MTPPISIAASSDIIFDIGSVMLKHLAAMASDAKRHRVYFILLRVLPSSTGLKDRPVPRDGKRPASDIAKCSMAMSLSCRVLHRGGKCRYDIGLVHMKNPCPHCIRWGHVFFGLLLIAVGNSLRSDFLILFCTLSGPPVIHIQ